MELQLILVLLIAFLLLGPEGMLNVATKLGEFIRKAREIIDQIKMEAYLEDFNRKMMEEEKRSEGEPSEDIAGRLKKELEDVYEEETPPRAVSENKKENVKEEKKEDGQSGKASGNASDGASERTKV